MRDVVARLTAYVLVGVFWGITAISLDGVYKSVGSGV
jgi:hypothetical protein